MSINHRGTHIRMPQQFLHRSDIRPGLKQMSRETVAKRVATDLLVNLRTQHRQVSARNSRAHDACAGLLIEGLS